MRFRSALCWAIAFLCLALLSGSASSIGFGEMGGHFSREGADGTVVVPAVLPTGAILRIDGTSNILRIDGTSLICRAGGGC